MVRNFTMFAILFAAILSTSLVGEERIRLEMGQSTKKHFLSGADLVVNRKGIIDLHQTSDRTWTITGLRTGFVMITQTNPASGQQTKTIVEVVKKKTARVGSTRKNLPSELCHIRNIQCDYKTGRVSGEASKWRWFLWAKQRCKNRDSCHFAVRLSTEARQSWQMFVDQRLHGITSAIITSVGEILIPTSCQNTNNIKVLSRKIASATGWRDDDFRIVCRSGSTKQIQVELLLGFFEKQSWRKKDFLNPTSSIALSNPAISFTDIVREFQYLKQNNRGRILAHPKLATKEHTTVRLESGGELEYTEPATANQLTRTAWKRYGIEIEFQISNIDPSNYYLGYDVKVSQRKTFGGGFSTGALKGEVDLPANVVSLVGLFESEREQEQSSNTWGLNFVPIIGPLFGSTAAEFQRSCIAFWAKIRRKH